MHIHFLQHVPFEGPAVLSQWAGSNNIECSGTRFFAGHALPEPEQIDLLVIMGGPMGVYDEERYDWLLPEKKFIAKCLSLNIKIVGICLGAQLLAEVLGAQVYAAPEKEIGWYPVTWNPEALKHPYFNFLPEKQMVLHWHGDAFRIPEGAVRLASSAACSDQGFLFEDRVLGLQFHLEMTVGSLKRLIEHSEDELSVPGGYIQRPSEMLSPKKLFEEANQSLYEIFSRLIGR